MRIREGVLATVVRYFVEVVDKGKTSSKSEMKVGKFPVGFAGRLLFVLAAFKQYCSGLGLERFDVLEIMGDVRGPLIAFAIGQRGRSGARRNGNFLLGGIGGIALSCNG